MKYEHYRGNNQGDNDPIQARSNYVEEKDRATQPTISALAAALTTKVILGGENSLYSYTDGDSNTQFHIYPGRVYDDNDVIEVSIYNQADKDALVKTQYVIREAGDGGLLLRKYVTVKTDHTRQIDIGSRTVTVAAGPPSHEKSDDAFFQTITERSIADHRQLSFVSNDEAIQLLYMVEQSNPGQSV